MLGSDDVCGDDSGPASAEETIESVRRGKVLLEISLLLSLGSLVALSDASTPTFPEVRLLGLLEPGPCSVRLIIDVRRSATGDIVSGEAIKLASVRGSVVVGGVGEEIGTTLHSLYPDGRSGFRSSVDSSGAELVDPSSGASRASTMHVYPDVSIALRIQISTPLRGTRICYSPDIQH